MALRIRRRVGQAVVLTGGAHGAPGAPGVPGCAVRVTVVVERVRGRTVELAVTAPLGMRIDRVDVGAAASALTLAPTRVPPWGEP